MFYLNDGGKELWQWDTNRILVVEDSSIVEVHFANKSMSKSLVRQVKQEAENRVVSIPNILLQDFLDIKVYAFDGEATKHEKVFKVRKRPKPENYVYTETDVIRIETVVQNAIAEAVKEVDEFITPRLAYDYVITTQEEFMNLSIYRGRIYVDTDLNIVDGSYILNFYGSELVFNPNKLITVGDIFSTSTWLSINGQNSATIKDLRVNVCIYATIDINNFVKADNVIMNIDTSLSSASFKNCKHLSNCTASSFNNCDFIDNCTIYCGRDAGRVTNCNFICGIRSINIDGSKNEISSFYNCKYISNVECDSTYENCLYVDAATCKGFVTEDNIGAVQKITTNGSFATLSPLLAPETAASYDTIPKVARNTSKNNTKVDYITATNGIGGSTIPIRCPDGSLQSNCVEGGEYTTDNTLVNLAYLTSALSKLQEATILGEDIPSSQSWDDAISKQDYGLYFVKGEDVTIEYTANNELQSCTGGFHFIIKYNNGVERIIHIYPKEISIAMGIKVPSITSFDGLLASDIKITNGSTQYGCRVVKMKMKNIQGE